MKDFRDVPTSVLTIAMVDQPDGFHRSHGYMTAGASINRILCNPDATVIQEELNRLTARLRIDQFGKDHGATGMPQEYVEAIQKLQQFLLLMIGGEL